jgi:hypothetical protein
MADKKISALTAATAPLAGTEVLPIVQSGATVKATVANIVGAGTSPGSFTTVNATGNISTAGTGSKFVIAESTSTNGQSVAFRVVAPNSDGSANSYQVGTGLTADDEWTTRDLTSNQTVDKYVRGASGFRSFWVNGTEYFKINASGNLVVVNSGNGIDFSATAGTGTSELLADYEEGTWTPTITAGSGSYTTVANQAGTYTKVGRQVTLKWYFVVTDKGTGAGSVNISNLPFASNASAGNFYAGSGYDTSQGIGQTTTMTATTSIDSYKYDGTDPIVVSRGQVGQITYFV